MTRCVLFDIDNTLLMKKPSVAEKVFEIAAPIAPGMTMSDVERAYAQSELWQGEQIRKENETGIRMPDEEYLQNVFRVYQQALMLEDQAYEALRGVFMGDYPKRYETAPEALETLRQLKSRGFALGIVSNNRPAVRADLDEQGLTEFFDSIVISEEVGLYKPDPKILELACRQMKVACEESVYVGDHPFDILCAHSARMAAIWMPVNSFMKVPAHIGPPEHTVSALAEILNVLGQ